MSPMAVEVIAFDVGRTLPNTDLSRDFMGLVVDGLVNGYWDELLPGNSEKQSMNDVRQKEGC